MKITRLATHFDTDQVITVLELLNELREALYASYQHDIEHWREQQYLQQQQDRVDQSLEYEPFDDGIDF